MTTQSDLVGKVLAASREGRDVLFLTGAGLSVEAGIPSVAGLKEYLAKVHCYITQGAFNPTLAEELRKDPSGYLRDFGWPEPHQLHAELWRWIDASCQGDRDHRDRLDYHIRAEYLLDLARQDGEIRKQWQAELARRDELGAGFYVKPVQESGLWNLEGNWKTLLSHLTQANQDYVDTLFQRLTRDRLPGMSHRLLAFLTPFLGLRLFLTVNFDELLEGALRDEGMAPAVYAVSRESPLPHPSLVRDELSVIKLHGSSFGLRVGEDLDHPLDEDSKRRLGSYLPEHPVLIVLGLGGADRRIMDFVKLVAKRPGTETFWLHFEESCPAKVADLAELLKADSNTGSLTPVRTCAPAAFLLELCNRFAGTHPPGTRGYMSQMPRLVTAEAPQAVPKPAQPSEPGKPGEATKPIQLFTADSGCYGLGATLQMAQFLASQSRTHTPIWIDLESTYKYSDAVVEVIRLIRKQDRTVAPIGLLSPEKPAAGTCFEQALRRIFDALLRGKYVLAFDGIGAFGRPPTEHHGHEMQKEKPQPEPDFLTALVEAAIPQPGKSGQLRDSFLAFAVGAIADNSTAQSFHDKISTLDPSLIELPPAAKGGGPLPPLDALDDDLEPLLVLAAFRRRRSYVALLRLLPGHLHASWKRTGAAEDQVQKFLGRYEASHYILRAEGGDYWMGRRLRDQVYDLAAQASGPDRPQKLALLAGIHHEIAGYYGDLLAAAQDASALLEQIYHRIAALRYWTELDESVPAGQLPAIFPGKTPAELRYEELRVLCRIFQRERETLLSRISSDTLIGWIEYIENHDVDRFKCKERLEEKIEDQCTKLESILVDLKGDALRDKMDYRECMEIRIEQILCGRGCCPPRAFDESGLTEEGRHALIERVEKAKKEKNWDTLQELMHRLGDIWLCLRCIGDARNAEPLRQMAKAIFDQCSQPGKAAAGSTGSLDLLHIRWLRHEADHALRKCSPWDWEEKPDAEQPCEVDTCGRSLWQKCDEVIATCDEALATIEWAAAETYPRHRSYFHSLKGKARYLRREFDAALRELNLAASGVAPSVGANRETLAVGMLRVAECVMWRARVGFEQGEAADLPKALSRARRRLNRAESELEKAEGLLLGARQNMEWWSCLYQLQAQLQVERLLLLLTGARSCTGSEAGRSEDASLLAQLTHGVQEGLSAIRQGLDVLLPVLPVQGAFAHEESFRVRRFLRIWIELMLCSVTLRPLIRYDLDNTDLYRMWERWEQVNESMGLGLLLRRGEELKELFLGIHESYHKYLPIPEATGLKARNDALQLMRFCFEERGGLDFLFKRVIPAAGEPAAAAEVARRSDPRPPAGRRRFLDAREGDRCNEVTAAFALSPAEKRGLEAASAIGSRPRKR